MHGAPVVYLNHRGGLAGLGQQAGPFSEEALFALQAELQQVRAEADAVEAEIVAVRTGRPVPARPTRPVQVLPGPPAAPVLPGGAIKLPGVGRVPVLAIGAVAALLLFATRRK